MKSFIIIPLHRLWAKSNNRERGQFECARHIQIDHALYILGFVFVLISFVHMHGVTVVPKIVGEGGR